jgi:hypothetical protein
VSHCREGSGDEGGIDCFSGEQGGGEEEVEEWKDRLFGFDVLEFSGSAVWIFVRGAIFGVVWSKLSKPPREGEHSHLVSPGLWDSDETPSDRSFP